MSEEVSVLDVIDAVSKRREERRNFLRAASGVAVGMGGIALLAACDENNDDNCPVAVTPTPAPAPAPSPTPTPQGPSDADILNFALNLEYLEAQFYSYAAAGVGLAAANLTGTGTQGAVNAAGATMVPFTDPVVREYAREINQDETAHVLFLRGALGTAAVSQPAIDISVGPNSAFSAAARSAGLIGPGATFNPYANDENFLLGAYIFEDVGVTAYKGASPLITSKVFLEAAAGILAAEAYHAGLIRTVLYAKGVAMPSLRTSADAISDARDSLDGPTGLDQGISAITPTTGPTPGVPQSNIVPLDTNGLAYSRSPGQVLNIVYLRSTAGTSGGFFPAGVNGTNLLFRTSGAN